jgi:hypothetical protein
MADDLFFAISVDRANNSALEAAQSIVRNHANGWWHRHVNLWIVCGLTAEEWRVLIKPVLSTGSSVLVLQLPPEETKRDWAYSGPDAKNKCGWLHRNYTPSE